MPFASSTPQLLGKYLGYPASDDSADTIGSALSRIETMSDTTYSTAAIATIEGYLAELATIFTGINVERDTEGSTLLPELRREARRHIALLSVATGLDVYADVVGSSQTS
jgi:transcriptional regulator GlxA family with amidase domain